MVREKTAKKKKQVVVEEPKNSGSSVQKLTGLVFPIHRIRRQLKKGSYAKIISKVSAVYMAAVMEYMSTKVLEMAGNAATDNKKSRISPRFIQLGVRTDDELNKLLQGTIIASGGVMPFIQNELLPKRRYSKSAKTSSSALEELKKLFQGIEERESQTSQDD